MTTSTDNRWLTELPSHWDVRRNGRLFKQTKLSGSDDLPILTVSLHDGVTVRDMNDHKQQHTIEDRTKYKQVKQGDIAYNMMRMWQGAVGIAPTDGLVSPAYVTARPLADVNAKYYEYLFRTSMYMGEVEGYSRGIVSDRNRLYWEEFKQIPSPYPPPAEQRRIVEYLSQRLADIDRFITQKRQLIELLGEQERRVASDTVFGKDIRSGHQDLIGLKGRPAVPDSWQVLRTRYVLREVDERSIDGTETHLSMVQGRGLVPATDTDSWRMHSASYAGGKICRPGDLVLNRLKAHLSVFFPAQQVGVISPDYSVYRMLNGNHPRYFELLFKTPQYNDWFRRNVRGITEGLWRLYTPDFYDLRCPVPPPQEQLALVRKYDRTVEQFATAKSRIEHEVSLIDEFRSSLIAEVVTGKIDVRSKT